MKNKPSIMKQLNAWLRKPGNTRAKLAVALGYESSGTIDVWLSRKSVPEHKKTELTRVLRGEV